MPINEAALDDSCALARALKVARLKLIAGESEIEVEFGEDKVRFAKGSIAQLDQEIARQERLCEIAQGAPARPLRRPIRAGFRRL